MEKTFYDIEGNEIAQDVWEQSFDAFYGGMEQMPYVISWKAIEAGELIQISCQDIFAELADSYWGHSLTGNSFNEGCGWAV